MIYYKTPDDLEKIRDSAAILAKAHGEVAKIIKPGVKTLELDRVAEEYILDHQAKPSFKGFNGFPSSLCISINENVVHGFPSEYELKEGDIVSIDCGVFHKGFHSDCAYTYGIGELDPKVKQLLEATEASLYKGIEQAIKGNRIGDIGYAVQSYVEDFGFTVVRELVGHGVGKNLHESPEVPNYGRRGNGVKLKPGMVLAIEPMINLGKRNVVQESDGWTIRTADRQPSAHFEHTVAVTETGTEIITSHEYIKEYYKG